MDSTASERAIKGGALVPAMNQCFADNSLETFGLREVVALRLRQRLQKRAILALLPALRYLCRNHGGTLLQRLKTESFREALAALSAPDDRLSRLFLAAFAPGLRAKARGVKRCFVQSVQ